MLYIDYKSGLPIYEQVYNGIMRLAALGILQPGAQLPSVRSVAADAGVNPNTVQKALSVLEGEVLLYADGTVGRFVTGDESVIRTARDRLAREAVRAFLREMEQLGIPKEALIESITKEDTEHGTANPLLSGADEEL